MKLGIVGLPNVGKSTLFNALTNAGIQSANFPFCTVEPNIGVVAVPDNRLNLLAKIYNPKKVTCAFVKFFDIAGLVKGASKGEGLGNRFLSNIRESNAIIHVVRCFDEPEIIHVNGEVHPKADVETIETELILSDLELIERKIQETKKFSKTSKANIRNLEFYEELKDFLGSGNPARLFKTNEDDLKLNNLNLLTNKPTIFVANVSEEDFVNGIENCKHYRNLKDIINNTNAAVIPICSELEMQISDMSLEDKKVFLADLGLSNSSLDRLITSCYELLGLISFLTAGNSEVKAWTIKNGTKASQAAGKIHSDIERGFIRAEIVPCEILLSCGSFSIAKEKGLVKSEGKDYIIKDGDVVLFRFNV
ncbi:MAG: redox-regulated ATPase YchF [Oscillospiraceae bacterium]|nr:redox-regulated ATPase YchF [Oscillospiraceae bacterium]